MSVSYLELFPSTTTTTSTVVVVVVVVFLSTFPLDFYREISSDRACALVFFALRSSRDRALKTKNYDVTVRLYVKMHPFSLQSCLVLLL